MNAEEISARELRENQSDVLNKIAFGGAHFIVTRHGKGAAVLISLNEFELLQKAMEYLEDQSDIEDAKEALELVEREGTKPLEQLAKELDIDV